VPAIRNTSTKGAPGRNVAGRDVNPYLVVRLLLASVMFSHRLTYGSDFFGLDGGGRFGDLSSNAVISWMYAIANLGMLVAGLGVILSFAHHAAATRTLPPSLCRPAVKSARAP